MKKTSQVVIEREELVKEKFKLSKSLNDLVAMLESLKKQGKQDTEEYEYKFLRREYCKVEGKMELIKELLHEEEIDPTEFGLPPDFEIP